MALPRDIFRELEDIVGTENISEDPAVLDAYAYQRVEAARGLRPEDRYYPRPGAAVLPGSTEEVQKVIKLCNRRGIKSKASSTGYGSMNAVEGEGSILLDMRRMNRILEIDEKNMYVVVEPYVSFAQVQGEVQKRGLNCHVIGAGSNCSYLASHTSVHGTSTQAISHGWSGRNVLGVEWVLPSGEILRLGSMGSGCGWFSGDGPGPSLRGIMRGAAGALGGLGVFTKCAGHLHPWPGPKKLRIKGVSPYYEAEVPTLFEYHMIEWPTWGQCADGIYKIGEAGIALALHKTGGPGSHGATVTGSNNEYYEKWDELKQIPWVSYIIVTAGNTPGGHAYQVKVLDTILKDTGGKILPLGEQPIFKNCDYINMIKGCFIPRTAFRLTGAMTCPLTGSDSVDHCAMGLSFDQEFRRKYDESGVLMDDAVNEMWGVAFEGAHFALCECGHFWGPQDEESGKGVLQMMEEGRKIQLKTPLAVNWMGMGERAKELGPLCYDYHDWMRKVKKTLDPNAVSDPSNYISAT
jgi:glycolate oxidase